MFELIIGITGILLAILIPLISFIYRRRRKLKVYYEIMWKKSSKLKPNEVLGIRGGLGFDEYYHKRPVDEIVKKKIEYNHNVLIVGSPLSGKSRAVWQALTTLNKPHDIIIPRPVDIDPEDFHIPFRFTFWRKSILLLDDIDRFAEKRGFMHLLQEFLERNTIIVASCCSGPEYNKLRDKMKRELSSIFGDPIEIPEIPREEATKVADQVGRELPISFDGNIGSIFLQLDTMKERFQHCSEVEKGILRSIKRLDWAGIDRSIYGENDIYSIEKIKRVCMTMEEINMKNYEWIERLRELEKKGFIETVKNGVRAEEAYFGDIIGVDYSRVENFNDMIRMFSNDFETLGIIGFKACAYGGLMFNLWGYAQKTNQTMDPKSVIEYFQVAVTAFEHTLEIRPPEHQIIHECGQPVISEWHPIILYNLGVAYIMLSMGKPNKVENCEKAAKAYREVLRIYEKLGISKTNLKELSLTGTDLEEAIDRFCKDKTKKKTSYIT